MVSIHRASNDAISLNYSHYENNYSNVFRVGLFCTGQFSGKKNKLLMSCWLFLCFLVTSSYDNGDFAAESRRHF